MEPEKDPRAVELGRLGGIKGGKARAEKLTAERRSEIVCADYQNATLRDRPTKHVEADEIWAFVAAKEKNVPEQHRGEFGWGDVWTWVAIDQDSRLIVTWLVGTRGPDAAHEFIADLRSRVSGRVQITTDGYKPYLDAIRTEFGTDVDYAQLKKEYGADLNDRSEIPQARKYSRGR